MEKMYKWKFIQYEKLRFVEMNFGEYEFNSQRDICNLEKNAHF